MKRGDEGSGGGGLEHWAGHNQGPERGGRDSTTSAIFCSFLSCGLWVLTGQRGPPVMLPLAIVRQVHQSERELWAL